jgi:hypothetical protein
MGGGAVLLKTQTVDFIDFGRRRQMQKREKSRETFPNGQKSRCWQAPLAQTMGLGYIPLH